MRLALHIISRIGFGVRLLWPGEKPDDKETDKCAAYGSNDIPEGHSMCFEGALEGLLDNLVWVLLAPKWLLSELSLSLNGSSDGDRMVATQGCSSSLFLLPRLGPVYE